MDTRLPASAPFSIGPELGRGAMGVVHAATHRDTGAQLAIKFVQPGSDQAQAGLENEILAMARLNHPGLLYLYDYGLTGAEDDPTYWLAVERASGGSLEDWRPKGWEDVAEVLDGICGALAHAHARGMVHRDLKPANLLRATARDHRPGLKIADFGLAVVHDVKSGIRRGGTPLYMPPEQYHPRYGEVGPWSDLYALGAMLWEFVCGQPPFTGEVKELLKQHVKAPLPAFAPRFAVPPELEPTLRQMLDKQPDARPSSIHRVREVLVDRSRAGPAEESVGARLPGMGAGLIALREWRLVGREDTRAALRSALNRMIRTGSPQSVLLTGPEGSGRRRLARWLANSAAENGLAEVIFGPKDAARALAMAERGPVVVVFERLDAAAEHLLTTLAFSHRPVLCLTTADSAEAWPDLPLVPGFTHLELGPMEPAAFRDLLETELGLTGVVAVRLDRQCGYLPGIAVAWLEELARRGELRGTPAGFDADPALLAAPLAQRTAPAALAEALESATAEELRALRLGAALGDRVYGEEWFPLLAQHDLAIPHQALQQLLVASLIRRHADGLSWASSAVRAELLGQPLSPAEHREVARMLAKLPRTPERQFRRAVHQLHAGQTRIARRALLSHDGGLTASAMERAREAVAVLRNQMDGATPDEEVQFHLTDLRVHLNLVSGMAAVPLARSLVERIGTPSDPTPFGAALDPALLVGACTYAARVFAFEGYSREALALVDAMEESATTLRCRSLLAAQAEDLPRAEAWLRRALELTTSPHQEARLANGLGSALGRAGRHEQAVTWFQVAAERIEPEQVYTPLGNLALSLLCLGRYDEAMEAAREAFRAVQHRGARRVAMTVLMVAMSALFVDEGELDQVADQALFSVRRYKILDSGLYRELLDKARPRRASSRQWVDAMRYAFAETDDDDTDEA